MVRGKSQAIKTINCISGQVNPLVKDLFTITA